MRIQAESTLRRRSISMLRSSADVTLQDSRPKTKLAFSGLPQAYPMEDEKEHISSGSHSINLGAGSSVKNSSLHIGDIHNHGHSNARPVAVIGRVHSTPLSVLGTPIKAGWLIISGIVGFIGSIASIVGLSQHLSLWFVLLLSVAGLCLIAGIALVRQRFIRVPYLPFNFEADRDGKVFFTKIEGNCPLCDGKLKLRDIGQNDQKVTYVRCTRNPDHIWSFDFTVLNEPKS